MTVLIETSNSIWGNSTRKGRFVLSLVFTVLLTCLIPGTVESQSKALDSGCIAAGEAEQTFQEELNTVENQIADLTVNVLGPDWLIDLLPRENQDISSIVEFQTDNEQQAKAVEVLKLWCSLSGDPSIQSFKLEEINSDILLIEDLNGLIASEPSLESCLNGNGLVPVNVFHQVFAFDGALPMTRMMLDPPHSGSSLSAILAGLMRPNFDETTVTVPHENVVIEPRKTSDECVDADPQSWAASLLDGWLVEGSDIWKPENRRAYWPKDPRVPCAATEIEVAPAVEVPLISLSAGAPNATVDPGGLVPSSGTEASYLCAADKGYACIPHQLYADLNLKDLRRFIRRLCEFELPVSFTCDNLPDDLKSTYKFFDTEEFEKSQLDDLLQNDGTGIFILPVRAVLQGTLDRDDIENGPQTSDLVPFQSAGANRIRALQNRMAENPVQVIPLGGEAHDFEVARSRSFGLGMSPYVQSISILVHRDLLRQVAVDKYFNLLLKEWSPKDENSSSLVTTNELRASAGIELSHEVPSDIPVFSQVVPCVQSDPVRENKPEDEPLVYGGSGGGSESERTLCLGHVWSGDDARHKAVTKFAEMLEANSNGRIEVNIYPNGELGRQNDLIESAQLGMCEMTIAGSNLQTFAPIAAILELPFAFASFEEMKAAAEGEIGERIEADIAEGADLLPLAYLARSPTVVVSNRQINTPEDLKGLNIRSVNTSFANMWSALDASVVPVQFSEIFTSFTEGKISAVDIPLNRVKETGLHEFVPYLNMTMHTRSWDYLLISRHAWDRLSEEDQSALRESANAAQIFYHELTVQFEHDLLDELEGSSMMEIIQPDFERFNARVKDAVLNNVDQGLQPVVEQLFRE